MIHSCTRKTKDSLHLLDEVLREDRPGIFSIAAEESTNKHNFDFDNLVDALEYVKQIGSAVHYPNGIRLVLDLGTHLWYRSNVLKQGLSRIHPANTLAYFYGINLEIIGKCNRETKIVTEDFEQHIIFDRSNVRMHDLTFAKKRELHTPNQDFNRIPQKIFTGLNSVINIEKCNIFDTSFKMLDGSVFRFISEGVFCTKNTEEREFLIAGGRSYCEVMDIDFGRRSVTLDASGASMVYFHNNHSANSVGLSPKLNFKAPDRSEIYDAGEIELYQK